jgi:hypothetical protein
MTLPAVTVIGTVVRPVGAGPHSSAPVVALN